MALKLPKGKDKAGKSAKGDKEKRSLLDAPLPIIGRLPIATQIKLLGTAAVVFLLATAVAAYLNNLEISHRAGYVLHAAGVQFSAERLAKDAGLALGGQSDAFDELENTRKTLADDLNALDKGAPGLPPTSGAPRASLDKMLGTAKQVFADLDKLEAGRSGLVTLAITNNAINVTSEEFRTLTQQIAESGNKQQATEFALAVERVARDAAGLLASDISLNQVARMGIDTYAAENALAAMPVTDPNVQRISDLFQTYRNSVEILVGLSRSLVDAKAAVLAVQKEATELGAQGAQQQAAYQATQKVRNTGIATAVAGAITLLLLMLLAKEYLEDARRRAKESELANQRNQHAILRLMNEMADLADGDLTIKATVTDDITGAIADSVNYTTEELRNLVAGVMKASEKVEQSSGTAQSLAQQLLAAAQKQAKELNDTGEAVKLITNSIQEVDRSATQSSEVARHTLEVTEQGAHAVRNTIAGMDSIREQIQETAKRIKRLGESSQEIGEIVDLISDITEQTNVLALNAAIQAASAGEAGRGFSVVAEEVQRLAERSAEATKQIGALVKTIQGDTQSAVAAMEQSTQGVVEGAKLSDSAGQALQEIEQVSRQLAELINSITVSTQVQSDMANEVATAMADILKITEQTTEGTQNTATSVSELAALAVDLRASVAGFKL
jgi:twitching motility protein PilJ